VSTQTGIACGKCGQMNERRGKGLLERMTHQSSDYACFACGTPFPGGPASLGERLRGLQAHFLNYVGMTLFFAGVGAVALALTVRIFMGPGPLFEILAWTGAAIGGLCGVAVAERNRQRGEILHRRRAD